MNSCMIFLILILPVCVVSWNSTWGSNPIEWGARSNYEIVLENGNRLPVGYGTSSSDIVDNVCVPSSLPAEDCEVLVDQLFVEWYASAYAPQSHVENWEMEYFATRGTIISILQDRYSYKSYLEIGTNQNILFRQARAHFPTAVGVDPNMGGTHRMTSDDFFKTNEQYFDIIFVDGLHEANQVYRDIRNSLKWLLPGGTILIHDCNPRGNLSMTAMFPRPEGATIWNGDTWKTAVTMRLVKDLEIVIVDIDHGVGVIRRRQNNHPLPDDLIDLLGVSPISMLDNHIFRKRKHEMFRFMSIDQMLLWLDEENMTVLPP